MVPDTKASFKGVGFRKPAHFLCCRHIFYVGISVIVWFMNWPLLASKDGHRILLILRLLLSRGFKCRLLVWSFTLTFFKGAISVFEHFCICDYLFLKNISADGQNTDLQWKNRREFHRKYLKSASALTHWRKSLIADEKFEICTYRHLKISKCIWLNLSFTIKNVIALSRIWFLQLKSCVGSSAKLGRVSNLLRPTSDKELFFFTDLHEKRSIWKHLLRR